MSDTTRDDCPATSASKMHPGHTHTCVGWHLDDGLHFCATCVGGAWFYLKPEGARV